MIQEKNLFIALCERLRDKVSELNFVDLWLDQLSDLGENLPVFLPAAFLEIKCNWDGFVLGRGQQRGEATIRVHLVMQTYAETESLSLQQSTALLMYDIAQKIYLALQGFGTEQATPLIRKGETDIRGLDAGLYELIVPFATSLRDDTKLKQLYPTTTTHEQKILKDLKQ